jgi:SAM-dependent methyltransferase
MDYKAHWSHIYQSKPVTQVSWYQTRPQVSLDFIRETGVDHSAQIIDVGAGASTLVDHLLDEGFHKVTLLDLSGEALEVARERLGARGDSITWIEGDVTRVELPEHAFDLWHDRAVFHFLTDPAVRERYVAQARRAVKVGGYVIVATFALDGPTQCSGLDVARYDADSLHAAFGDNFERVSFTNEAHRTPWDSEQRFVYCCCRIR